MMDKCEVVKQCFILIVDPTETEILSLLLKCIHVYDFN